MTFGFATQLAIDEHDPATHGFGFVSANVAAAPNLIDGVGLHGTRGALASQGRVGTVPVTGVLRLTPSPQELQDLLPWLIGPSGDDGQYGLSDLLATRYVTVDNSFEVLSFDQCVVSRAIWQASAQQPLRLDIELVGRSETRSGAGTFPSVAYSDDELWMFEESTFSAGATDVPVSAWRVTLDNQLVARYAQSRQASQVIPRERVISFECSALWSAESAALQQASAGPVSLSLSHPAGLLQFNFALWQPVPRAPAIEARDELTVVLAGRARRPALGAELSVQLSGA